MTPPLGRRIRPALRVAAVNVAAVALLLAGVEAAVRWAHPEIRPGGYDRSLIAWNAYGPTAAPTPGASGEAGGVLRHVDERGLWQTRHARAGTPAWLFLGDSVTMGPGVDADSTFAARLGADAETLDVQNAALIGYSSADYVRVLRGRLARTDATRLRRVTLVWCLNDVYADRPVAGVPGGARSLEGPVAAWARRHVHTAAWAKATFADRPLAYARFDAALYRPGSPHLAAALADLDTLAALARRAGVAFDVAVAPYAAQFRTPDAATGAVTGAGDRQPQRVLLAALAARGIPALDLAAAFPTGDAARKAYLYGDGLHLSADGHRRVAGALQRWRPHAGAVVRPNAPDSDVP